MKQIIFTLAICASSFLYGQQKDYPIQAVPFTQVKLSDNFWLPRIEINRTVTIPASFERCESTGRVKNFVMAADKKGKFCTKYPFDDIHCPLIRIPANLLFLLLNFQEKAVEGFFRTELPDVCVHGFRICI